MSLRESLWAQNAVLACAGTNMGTDMLCTLRYEDTDAVSSSHEQRPRYLANGNPVLSFDWADRTFTVQTLQNTDSWNNTDQGSSSATG